MKRIKPNLGDVFKIRVQDNLFCYGQIVIQGAFKGYAIFDYIGKTLEHLEEITRKKIILLAYITDNYIWNGQWSVIGNYKITGAIKTKFYKSGDDNSFAPVWLMDCNLVNLRIANTHEIQTLPLFENPTPALFERAIRAFFGLEKWLPEFMDYMLYDGARPHQPKLG